MLEALKQLFFHPPIEAVVFWLCTAVAVASALVAAFSRRIVRAANALFFTLFAMAGYYVLLGADFMAIVQVVVYIGGILALVLFGVLLTNRSTSQVSLEPRTLAVAGALAALALFIILLASIMKTDWNMLVNPTPPDIVPTTRTLGHLLLGAYLLPFEFISLTLLIALLGALYLVRREDE